MDALEAIFTRRSTRRMKAELPPREMIERVIEAGRAAPQRWKQSDDAFHRHHKT